LVACLQIWERRMSTPKKYIYVVEVVYKDGYHHFLGACSTKKAAQVWVDRMTRDYTRDGSFSFLSISKHTLYTYDDVS